MNAKERITRGRIQLQSKHPFFAYLVLNLNIIEDEKVESCGVDANNNLRFNPKWVEKLTDGQIEMLLCHETLHLAFNHLTRVEKRDKFIWNLAGDICINNILQQNSFEMITTGLVPRNNEITLQGDIRITDINNKSAEYIYDEIYPKVPKTEVFIKFVEEGRFGEHLEEGKSGGEGQGKEEKDGNGMGKNAEKWKQLLTEASAYAQQRGDIPAGMERQVEILLNQKVDWKSLLYKYITNELPYDYSYSKPSRRSQATGYYMPSMKRENINVMVSVDTSGSISQEDLTDFMTEMINIAKSFNNLKMTAIICDCEIKEVLEVSNGNIDKLLNLKMQGGGGTSHIPVYEKILNEYPETKFLVAFTDGFTDFPETELVRTIWVLPKNANKEMPFGEVIEL